MDIKTLKYFLQICEDRSFSKASKNLYISQQGLSKAINKLEKEINVPLFYRTNNIHELTKYGEYLKSKAISIVYQFDILTAGLIDMVENETGYFKIGFSYGILNSLSIDLINKFKNLYPNIVLNIKEYTDFKCEEAVLNGDVDLGFTISYFNKNKFNSNLVKSEKLYALISKQNPLSNKKSIEFEDLKNEKIIVPSKHSKIHHNFLIKCLEKGFNPNILFETEEVVLIHELSKKNKGIGISTNFSHTPNCKINYIPFKDCSFSWDIYIITKKDADIDDSLQVFIDYILYEANRL